MIADSKKRRELEITIAEDVLVIGYPTGLRQGRTNHPIVRSGIIASDINQPIMDDITDGDGTRKRTIYAFLVDGATIPGSSGSPVVLKPVSGRVVGGKIRMSTAPSVLLGVIGETKYAPLKDNEYIKVYANLGLAYCGESIKTTIDEYNTINK